MGRNKKEQRKSAGKSKAALFAMTGMLGILAAFPAMAVEKSQSWEDLLPFICTSEGSENGEAALLPGFQVPGKLPERYDARQSGKAPVVKSQGTLGTCWALTVTSALEAALLPEEALEFSPDHLSLNNGFKITQNEGGDYMMAMAYLSGWYGPVLEEEDPYGDGVSPQGLAPRVHVQEMQLLEGKSREEIKQMILEYGPVQTSLYLDRKQTSSELPYYDSETYGYYYPEEKANTHDVLLLGWDDAYPKENFKIQPKRDGAYICQNTWGTDFGDQGIFYVSYEDGNIGRGGVAYTGVEPKDNYDFIYQTDVCGWQGQQGYDAETCYFANVYTAGEAENLEAVGFYNTGEFSVYEIYAVEEFSSEESFAERRLLQNGWLENKGYFTVKLDVPVALEKGQQFAVVVKITTLGAKMPVAVELNKDSYTAGVSLEGKRGYLSYAGDIWEFTEEKFGTNVCLKAYTVRR